MMCKAVRQTGMYFNCLYLQIIWTQAVLCNKFFRLGSNGMVFVLNDAEADEHPALTSLEVAAGPVRPQFGKIGGGCLYRLKKFPPVSAPVESAAI